MDNSVSTDINYGFCVCKIKNGMSKPFWIILVSNVYVYLSADLFNTNKEVVLHTEMNLIHFFFFKIKKEGLLCCCCLPEWYCDLVWHAEGRRYWRCVRKECWGWYLTRNLGKLHKEVFYNLFCLSGIVSVIKLRDRQDIMNWWKTRCAGHSMLICLTESVP